MQSLPSALIGAGIGATLAVVLDPISGRRRRSLMQDKLRSAARQAGYAAGKAGRDLANRTRGAVASARNLGPDHSDPGDEILVERVRATMGHFVSHPHAIGVFAHGGRVVLQGPILADEVGYLLSAIEGVPGVWRVESQLEPHDVAGGIPSLQGGAPRARRGFLARAWSPASGVLAAVGGAGLAVLLAREIARTPVAIPE
jgi:hypothetical protein